jgi:hypothetical protein
LSNFKLSLLAVSTMLWHEFFGEWSFIVASGYIRSTLLKTSHPCGLPLWGKEYGLSK